MNSITLKGVIPTILKGKFQNIEVIYDFIDNHSEIITTDKITIIDIFCDNLVLTDFLNKKSVEYIKKEIEAMIFETNNLPRHARKSTLADLI